MRVASACSACSIACGSAWHLARRRYRAKNGRLHPADSPADSPTPGDAALDGPADSPTAPATPRTTARSTCGTRIADGGGGVAAVAAHLRHKDLQTASRYIDRRGASSRAPPPPGRMFKWRLNKPGLRLVIALDLGAHPLTPL